MALINTILAPQESVNDQFLSLISLLVKTGEFIKADTLIAELETSKAVVEIRAEKDGYIKVFVEANTDIRIGSKMFEFYDTSIENDFKDDTVIENNHGPITEKLEKVKTIFSKAALQFIENNKINRDEFSTLSFVTTKDLIPKKSINETNTPVERGNIKTKEVNASEKTIKVISKSKKREFEYLYSVNSSSVISRLAVSISVSSKEIISKSQHFIKSTPLPSIVQEVSKLLLKYPNLNSFYLDGEQAFYKKVNIGFALDDGLNGLKVASILDADSLNLSTIEETISDLSLKYSANQLNIIELTSATFTITDLFNSNIISFHPLVNNNNSCILGISSLHKDEFIIDLSFDHRLTSGKEVSQFLSDLKFRLEARFNNVLKDYVEGISDVKCIKCYINLTEDIDGNIFFQKVINSKYNGYICSNCLNGW
jgi:pyruvate/2-oxoglutarate dehydrogenase complex dihydrolipoamide acyltransferase (E2) component